MNPEQIIKKFAWLTIKKQAKDDLGRVIAIALEK
jgi:hypothetical protein